jgi:hypothetical protein
MRYNSTTYTLSSAQICSQTHSGWLVPSTAASNNKEDLVMIFNTMTTTANYAMIILVVPILRTTGTTANPVPRPAYLAGLLDASGGPIGPFSLKDCMPSATSQYIYYAMCLPPYGGNTGSQNAYVFVNTTGVSVDSVIMAGIFKSGAKPMVADFINSGKPKKVVGTTPPISKYVMVTSSLLGSGSGSDSEGSGTTNVRNDSTDAYKCVPLDPDASIVNGQLQVNTDTGELLTDILAARQALKVGDIAKGAWDPGVLERWLGYFLGALFSLVFLCVGGYFLYNKLRPGASATAAAAAVVAAAAPPVTPAAPPATPAAAPKQSTMQRVKGLLRNPFAGRQQVAPAPAAAPKQSTIQGLQSLIRNPFAAKS